LKVDKDILELFSKFSCNWEDVVREYLKSLFDRHQTLDRQRRGSSLSRDDRVRFQYSPVRLAEVLVLNAIASTRGDNAVPNQKTGPNDKNAGEDCAESGTTAVLQEETFDEELSCEEFSAQKGEDANALAGVCFLDEKEEDNHTRATSAESLSDHSTCTSTHKCTDSFSIRINGTLFTGVKSSTDSSYPSGLDSGNENRTDAEETLKERNRRLLYEERQSLSQTKVRSSKQRGKHLRHRKEP